MRDEPYAEPGELAAEIDAYLRRLESAALRHELIDLGTAKLVARLCLTLLQQFGISPVDDHRRIVQTANRYFLLDDDAEGDVESIIAFDDDVQVVQAAHRYLIERSANV